MRRIRTLLTTLCLVALARGAAVGVGIAYTIEPAPGGATPHTHITVEITDVSRLPSIRLQMPAWSPGDYQIQNHAQYVESLRASGASGGPLPVTRVDPNTWEVRLAGQNRLTVAYDLPNVPPGNFTENVQVTPDYAFYQGSATFLYLVDHKDDPATVRVRLPGDWTTAISPLETSQSAPAAHEVRFAAPNYDTLADSPILAGHCATDEFRAGGATHVVALFGWMGGEKPQAYSAAIRPVAEEEIRLMGGAPYRRYVFFVQFGGRSGALEHAASCRIGWNARRGSVGAFQRFVAHEFFHAWNVKRIRPAAFGPFDYIHPPKTHLLWFFEGVTDYVAILSLRRAGIIDDRDYLAHLSELIEELQQTPARKRIAVEEASYRVWDARGSSGYGGLSYYLKGHMIGLCLDLKLRALTAGAASMDRLMRDLLRRYGPPRQGCPENGIRDALVQAGGEEMGRLYDRMCRSTEELPFAECLAGVGLRLANPDADDWRIEPDPAAQPAAVRLREQWLTGANAAARLDSPIRAARRSAALAGRGWVRRSPAAAP